MLAPEGEVTPCLCAQAPPALDYCPMRPQPSVAVRVLRGLVVLVTVWCTGCTGFEPLIDAALGRDAAAVVCASGAADMGGGPEMSAAAAERRGPIGKVSAQVARGERPPFSCGCTSCQAVTPVVLSFAHLPPLPLPPVAAPELPLASVVRVPLLPPPERAVA